MAKTRKIIREFKNPKGFLRRARALAKKQCRQSSR